MVPRGSMLCCDECVGAGLTRSKRTFSDAIRTIHWIRIELSQSVPVKAGSVVGKTVLDSDLESVAPSSTNRWSWKLTVDPVHDSRVSIGCKSEILDFKGVANNSAGIWPCSLYVGTDAVASSPALSSCWTIEAIGIGNIAKSRTWYICPWYFREIAVVRKLRSSSLRERSCRNKLNE